MKNKQNIKRVTLAYSGGLDTSVIIKWLIEEYGAEVIAFVADVGQGGTEVKPLKKKALASGAKKIIIKDLKEEFVKDYVFPMLRSGAVYEGQYLLGTSIARPIIAKAQMDVAKATKSDAVSHGATGKGNDQVRFELAYYAINPKIKVVAPWREWDFKGREDLMKFAKSHKIPVTSTKAKPYSMDANLYHISYEGGNLEDPWSEAKEDMYLWTTSPEKAPNKATYIEIDYKQGNPVAINGVKLSPAKLLEKLNKLGGKNGIGRADCVESRYVGMKSRGVYETPGGEILTASLRGMEALTMDREVMQTRDSIMNRYAQLVYNGYWFSPEREAIQALIDEASKTVNGTVRVKLLKGRATVVGRKSKNSLYSSELATFEEDSVYNQADADGFIKLNSLRLKIHRSVNKKR